VNGAGPEGGDQAGNPTTEPRVKDGVDDEEPEVLRAEGLDPDDPAVRAGIDLVRWELSMLDELAD
jgi:hypothetical protein